jgi:hypothetical protein
MNTNTAINLVICAVVLVTGFSIYYVGRYVQPPKQVFVPRDPVIHYFQVPVSDRITACEDKGGKYGLYWSNFTEKYEEMCQRSDLYIRDF